MSDEGEARATRAGWYPDPAMAGTRRYWDGQQWTEHLAPAVEPPPPAPRSNGGISVWVVAGGILVAALVIWVVYSVVHADDDLDCATKNADRALNGQPTQSCD